MWLKRKSGSNSPASLQTLIQERHNVVSAYFFAVIIVLFFTLEFFIIRNELHLAEKKLNEWVISNQTRISQSLFLENALSLKGLSGQFYNNEDSLVSKNITIYSSDKTALHGNDPFPEQKEFGFYHSLFPPKVYFFDKLTFADQNQGYVFLAGRHEFKTTVLHSVLVLFLCVFTWFMFRISLQSFLGLTKSIVLDPILRLKDLMSLQEKSLENLSSRQFQKIVFSRETQAKEVNELFDGYNNLIDEIDQYAQKEKEHAQDLATGRMAAQVAHDIRSPLLALTTLMRELTPQLSSVEEEYRVLLRTATTRIQDIANTLSGKKSVIQDAVKKPSLTVTSPTTITTELIADLLEKSVSEKRIQYRMLANHFELLVDVSSRCYSAFSIVHSGEFSRVISNMIDNAVEAIETDASDSKITLQLDTENNWIVLKVKDTGKGIAPDVLPKLMERGQSFGKTGGQGLGLYHAKQAIQSWGGDIQIDSILGKGTTVTIKLPKIASPKWFATELDLNSYRRIVVVDDDRSIHSVWDQRFKKHPNPEIQDKIKEIIHFEKLEELKDWYSQNKNQSSDVCFLIDYEFITKPTYQKTTAEQATSNGIEMIEALQIANQSYLVTSRFDDIKIRESCERLHLKLVPKTLVHLLPIH